MTSSFRPLLLPQYRSCTRRFTEFGLDGWRPSFQQQLRGKKKLSKQPTIIPVRLLQDVKTYGRKGAIVPVSADEMRNIWSREGIAEYIERKTLNSKDYLGERDHTFGVSAEELSAKKSGPKVEELAKPKQIDVERLTPKRSMELLDIFLPTHLDFFQPVKERPTPAAPAVNQSQPQRRRGQFSSAADVLAAASIPTPKETPEEPVGIFGSVTLGDVVSSIKDELARNEEAARVVLSEQDVQFTAGRIDEEGDRLKYIGEYEVEIKLKGAEGSVKRKVLVKPITLEGLSE